MVKGPAGQLLYRSSRKQKSRDFHTECSLPFPEVAFPPAIATTERGVFVVGYCWLTAKTLGSQPHTFFEFEKGVEPETLHKIISTKLVLQQHVADLCPTMPARLRA